MSRCSFRGCAEGAAEQADAEGLAKSGTKAELAQRLHAALSEEQEAVLQDQLEAQDELQRQFEESMMSPASRCIPSYASAL